MNLMMDENFGVCKICKERFPTSLIILNTYGKREFTCLYCGAHYIINEYGDAHLTNKKTARANARQLYYSNNPHIGWKD